MLMAIVLVYSISVNTPGKKVCRDLKMAAIWKFWNIKHSFIFYFRYEKIVLNYAKRGFFHGDEVIDDVTGWPQSRPSIHLYQSNKNIFHDYYKTNWDAIKKLPVYRYFGIMTIFVSIRIHGVIDDVSGSQRSSFEIAIFPRILQLEY